MSDEMRMPPVTTGVASSYDVPDMRHDVSNPTPANNPTTPTMLSDDMPLNARVALLETMVKLLWEKFMDKPIDVHAP